MRKTRGERSESEGDRGGEEGGANLQSKGGGDEGRQSETTQQVQVEQSRALQDLATLLAAFLATAHNVVGAAAQAATHIAIDQALLGNDTKGGRGALGLAVRDRTAKLGLAAVLAVGADGAEDVFLAAADRGDVAEATVVKGRTDLLLGLGGDGYHGLDIATAVTVEVGQAMIGKGLAERARGQVDGTAPDGGKEAESEEGEDLHL